MVKNKWFTFYTIDFSSTPLALCATSRGTAALCVPDYFKRGEKRKNSSKRASGQNKCAEKQICGICFGPSGEKCKVGENNDAIRRKLMAVSHPSATVGEED